MIVTFTDFGCHGPYLGQVAAVLKARAPGVGIIDLLNDAPRADPIRSAYLLAALARWWPPGTVFLGVVDPGVGTERLPVALAADGKWFVGPDNGLFHTVAAQCAGAVAWYEIAWRPLSLCASFHGRDWFAPVAAAIACGREEGMLAPWEGPDLSSWPEDLAQIVYLDHYGNAVSGLRYRPQWQGRILQVHGHRITQAHTFGEVAEGETLWYANSMGLVEVAVNCGNAAARLGIDIGTPLLWA